MLLLIATLFRDNRKISLLMGSLISGGTAVLIHSVNIRSKIWQQSLTRKLTHF